MRWRGRRQSNNIDDRRGRSKRRGRGLSGGVMILVIVVGLFFGQDVSNILGLLLNNSELQGQHQPQQKSTANQKINDDSAKFVSVVLAETEDTWNNVFAKMGQRYQAPKLVLYSSLVQSACGTGSAASGPFYCPGDRRIYIDLSFLNELRRMGAPGDFAFAYVIAHEVGHHVQNLVGIADQVRARQNRATKTQRNALSVRMELQADCLAGVWINHTEKRSAILEHGDIDEGLKAAAAVGDDQILKQAGRAVNREAFTHGSSAERTQWFTRGMKTGDLNSCDTIG